MSMAVYYSERDGRNGKNWIVQDSFLGILTRKRTKKQAKKQALGEAQSKADTTGSRVVVEIYNKNDDLKNKKTIEPV